MNVSQTKMFGATTAKVTEKEMARLESVVEMCLGERSEQEQQKERPSLARDHKRDKSASSAPATYGRQYEMNVMTTTECCGASLREMQDKTWDIYDSSTLAMEMTRGNYTRSSPTVSRGGSCATTARTKRTHSAKTTSSATVPPLSPYSLSSTVVARQPEDNEELLDAPDAMRDATVMEGRPLSTGTTLSHPGLEGSMKLAASGKKAPEKRSCRTCWVSLACIVTFMVPSSLLVWSGLSSPAAQIAWRQKVLLTIVVYVSCVQYVLALRILSDALCNVPRGITVEEVQENRYYIINGKVVLADLAEEKGVVQELLPASLDPFAGSDVSSIFPSFMSLARSKDNSTYGERVLNDCIQKTAVADRWLKARLADIGYRVRGKRVDCPSPGDLSKPALPCLHFPDVRRAVKKRSIGELMQTEEEIAKHARFDLADPYQRSFVILKDRVYDVTDYLRFAADTSTGIPVTSSWTAFLGTSITQLLIDNMGKDATRDFNSLDANKARAAVSCLDHLFYQGITPSASGPFNGCNLVHPVIFPVFLSIFMLGGVRFATGTIKMPSTSCLPLWSTKSKLAAHDPGVCTPKAHCITLVRCQNEPVHMIRTTIDNIARSDYEDSRRLLFVVCDGPVGPSTPAGDTSCMPGTTDTARGVLDVLTFGGQDPPPRAYISLGDGTKRVNFAKVYSGFYECGAHRVPYLLMVKTGNEAERNLPRPGCRGKRDTLHFVLRFLERVGNMCNTGAGAAAVEVSVMNLDMSATPGSSREVRLFPLEHELFRAAGYILGIDLRLHHYLAVVDAGVVVEPNCLSRMAARLTASQNIAAVTGSIRPTRAASSFVAALQVYEHYLTNLIDPCFQMTLYGSVVCCFNPGLVMYKLRDDEAYPLVASSLVLRQLRGDPHFRDTPLFRLGEDIRIGASILRARPGSKIVFEPRAVGYAGLPVTTLGMIRTGVRRFLIDWHRLVDLTFGAPESSSKNAPKDGVGKLPLKSRIPAFLSLIQRIISPGTSVFWYLLVLHMFFPDFNFVAVRTLPNVMVALSIIAVFSMHLIYHVSRLRPMYILYLVLYTVIGIPIFTVFMPLYAFWMVDSTNEDHDPGPTTLPAGGLTMPLGIRTHGCFDDTDEDRRPLAPQTCSRLTTREFDVLSDSRSIPREQSRPLFSFEAPEAGLLPSANAPTSGGTDAAVAHHPYP